jgi:hypothetical protein
MASIPRSMTWRMTPRYDERWFDSAATLFRIVHLPPGDEMNHNLLELLDLCACGIADALIVCSKSRALREGHVAVMMLCYVCNVTFAHKSYIQVHRTAPSPKRCMSNIASRGLNTLETKHKTCISEVQNSFQTHYELYHRIRG